MKRLIPKHAARPVTYSPERVRQILETQVVPDMQKYYPDVSSVDDLPFRLSTTYFLQSGNPEVLKMYKAVSRYAHDQGRNNMIYEIFKYAYNDDARFQPEMFSKGMVNRRLIQRDWKERKQRFDEKEKKQQTMLEYQQDRQQRFSALFEQGVEYYYSDVKPDIVRELANIENQVKTFKLSNPIRQREVMYDIVNRIILSGIYTCGFPEEVYATIPYQKLEKIAESLKVPAPMFQFTQKLREIRTLLDQFEQYINQFKGQQKELQYAD